MAERGSLVRLEKEFNIEVDWRGFELHPETPKGGTELKRVSADSDRPEMKDYLQRFAAKFGVEGMKSTGRIPNTRRALAMAEFAREQGKNNEFSFSVMDAHWRDGKNIEDDEVLRELAATAGLDAQKALAAADSPVYQQKVDDIRAEYKQVGVGGIPTFIIGSEVIEGCRSYDILKEAVQIAGAEPRQI